MEDQSIDTDIKSTIEQNINKEDIQQLQQQDDDSSFPQRQSTNFQQMENNSMRISKNNENDSKEDEVKSDQDSNQQNKENQENGSSYKSTIQEEVVYDNEKEQYFQNSFKQNNSILHDSHNSQDDLQEPEELLGFTNNKMRTLVDQLHINKDPKDIIDYYEQNLDQLYNEIETDGEEDLNNETQNDYEKFENQQYEIDSQYAPQSIIEELSYENEFLDSQQLQQLKKDKNDQNQQNQNYEENEEFYETQAKFIEKELKNGQELIKELDIQIQKQRQISSQQKQEQFARTMSHGFKNKIQGIQMRMTSSYVTNKNDYQEIQDFQNLNFEEDQQIQDKNQQQGIDDNNSNKIQVQLQNNIDKEKEFDQKFQQLNQEYEELQKSIVQKDYSNIKEKLKIMQSQIKEIDDNNDIILQQQQEQKSEEFFSSDEEDQKQLQNNKNNNDHIDNQKQEQDQLDELLQKNNEIGSEMIESIVVDCNDLNNINNNQNYNQQNEQQYIQQNEQNNQNKVQDNQILNSQIQDSQIQEQLQEQQFDDQNLQFVGRVSQSQSFIRKKKQNKMGNNSQLNDNQSFLNNTQDNQNNSNEQEEIYSYRQSNDNSQFQNQNITLQKEDIQQNNDDDTESEHSLNDKQQENNDKITIDIDINKQTIDEDQRIRNRDHKQRDTLNIEKEYQQQYNFKKNNNNSNIYNQEEEEIQDQILLSQQSKYDNNSLQQSQISNKNNKKKLSDSYIQEEILSDQENNDNFEDLMPPTRLTLNQSGQTKELQSRPVSKYRVQSSQGLYKQGILKQESLVDNSVAYEESVNMSMQSMNGLSFQGLDGINGIRERTRFSNNPGVLEQSQQSQEKIITEDILNQKNENKQEKYKKQKPLSDIVQNTQKKVLKQQTIKQQLKLLEGYLLKKSQSLMKGFEKRYFVLTKDKLYYYNSQKKEKMRGCINFKIAKCEIIIGKNLDFTIEIPEFQKSFKLKAMTLGQKSEWIDQIQEVIDGHKSDDKIYLNTVEIKKYFDIDSMTESEFTKEAETGDIILFATDNFPARMQRKFTGSKIDHVGIVIKFDNGDVKIFDASFDVGVGLMGWYDFIDWNDLYCHVVLRKLIYDKKEDIKADIMELVGETLGKKYQLTVGKLIKRTSIDPNRKKKNNKQQQNEGFFCSELVAKAYKRVGLLPQKKSACQYWPVDFTEKKDLQLLKGAKLSNEISIVLNRHIKQQY